MIVSTISASNDPCAPTPLVSSFNLVEHSTMGFGSSTIAPPPYGMYAGSDFWFSMNFGQAPSLIIEGSTPGFDPAIAVYQDGCTDPLLLYNIIDNNCDGSSGIAVIFDDLLPGTDYLIRVWRQGGGPGSFNVYYNDSANTPGFQVFNSASVQGDCIQLTRDLPQEQGCAYFDVPIDFSQPFTRSFTANFGTNDDFGADGICLIFQSGGINSCGISGLGIGAEGIANSFIVEFDTWENTENNDLFEDHAAININGNMNHASSVMGPVAIGGGNVEDGADHTITFSWNPAGNLYQVTFDGALILSGSFDIINNCFGGSNTAWWGFSSATGAFSNDQIVCPDIQEFEVGAQRYEEVSICDGDNYQGLTSSGFYIDVSTAAPCGLQVNTLLTVIALDTLPISDTICRGETVTIGTQSFDETGDYVVTIPNGECDSIVALSLFVIDPGTGGSSVPITCIRDGRLSATVTSSITFDSISYTWTSPSGEVLMGPTVFSDEGGNYELVINTTLGSNNCTFVSETILAENTTPPRLNPIGSPIIIPCDESGSITIAPAQANVIYQIITSTDTTTVDRTLSDIYAGSYVIRATDTLTGCTNDITFAVEQPGLDTLGLVTDTLNCIDTSARIAVVTINKLDSFAWVDGLTVLSTDTFLDVSEPGTYTFYLRTVDGCTIRPGRRTILVVADTLAPDAMLAAGTITCQRGTATLMATGDLTSSDVRWENTDGQVLSNSDSAIVSQAGVFYFFVTNPANGCGSVDSIEVQSDTDIPLLPRLPDTLTLDCDGSFTLLLPSLGTDEVYLFIDRADTLEPVDTITFTQAATYEIVILDTLSLCSARTTLSVEPLATGQIAVTADSIRCQPPYATISVTSDVMITDASWRYQGQVIADSLNLRALEPGIYSYTFTDEGGCVTNGSIEVIDIRVDPTIDFVSEMGVTCDDPGEIIVSRTFSDSVYWLDMSGAVVSESDTLRSSTPGFYTVFALDRRSGCELSEVASMEDLRSLDPVDASVSSVIDCDNAEVMMNATSAATNPDYLWITPMGDTLRGASHTIDVAGRYIVQLTNEVGCISSDTVEVTSNIDSIPIIGTVTPIDCNNALGQVEVTSDLSSASMVSWTGSSTFDEVNTGLITMSTAGTFTIQVMADNDCISEATFMVEDLSQDPQLRSLVGDTVIFITGGANQLEVSYVDSIVTSAGWLDASDLICDDPICNPAELTTNASGAYTYQVTTSGDCTAEVTIIVINPDDDERLAVYVPNAFSPNNDGFNDRFTAFANDENAVITTIQVFNRWGGLVFERVNVPVGQVDRGWDGTADGEPMDPGVFVYQLTVEDGTGQQVQLSGEIHLMR